MHTTGRAFVTCIVTTIMTTAAAQNVPTVRQEKLQVLAVVKKYAETIACSTSFELEEGVPRENLTGVNDVFLVKRNFDKYGSYESLYYVLWGGDVGCYGGSATSNTLLTAVSRDSLSKPLLVTTHDVFEQNFPVGSDTGELNTRFIESFNMTSPTRIEIISSNYADEKFGGSVDVGQNMPPNKFRYTFTYDNSGVEYDDLSAPEGKWRLINQVLLEQY